MRLLLMMGVIVILAGCGTRQFSLQKADGTEVGTVSVFRGLQTDEVILAEKSAPTRVFLCDWKSTLSGTKCFEAK